MDRTRGETLADRVERADRPWSRARGLLGRGGLAPGHGLWLIPCRQVHTCFMRFDIDVVFIDDGLRVVGLCRKLRPWRFSPIFWKARTALELAAGGAAGVEPGHHLDFAAPSTS